MTSRGLLARSRRQRRVSEWMSAARREAARLARAKKVPGEGHWQPAKAMPWGLKVIDSERFDTRWAAIKAARTILYEEGHGKVAMSKILRDSREG